jgi:hypothetical protein
MQALSKFNYELLPRFFPFYIGKSGEKLLCFRHDRYFPFETLT